MNYFLDPKFTDPKRIARERNKARELKKTSWWKQKIQSGICNYCEKKFDPKELTMDHIIPIARGGESVKNNIVPSCRDCNQKKKLDTPVDAALRKLSD